MGAIRVDRRAARIAAVIANRIPFQGKGAQAVREQELFASLKPTEEETRQTPLEMRKRMIRMTTAMGGSVKKAADFRREWEEKQARKPVRKEARRGEKRD